MHRLPYVLALLLALSAGAAARTAAQPQPPHRFFGPVTLDGATPPPGTAVLAFIGDRQCGTGEVRQDGRYLVDVLSTSQIPGCGTDGATITFQVGGVPARETATYRTGNITELALTAASAPPPPARRFTEAALILADPRPCMPAPCDPERAALWTGDEAAWAARGVFDPDARFEQIIIMRVDAGEPAVIGNIARILGQPYLQITRLRFAGSPPAQADEYIEVTNLGGGAQDMTGWTVRSPGRGVLARFPEAYVMNPAQSCRIYTGIVTADSCGTARFGGDDIWPDQGGVAVLYYDALDLLGAERRYSADPDNQPPQPDLQGVE